MPNLSNITSPFTLVGNGRSGTSLVSNIIKNHPDCTYVGETSNLIHSVYKAMVSSLPKERYKDIPEAMQKMFLDLFRTRQKHWFHKPIGIPTAWRFFSDEEKFLVWYWSIMFKVFPNAKFFTVLRNPINVIDSSHRWWGRPYKSIIDSMLLMTKILSHENSPVQFAIEYETLIKNPEEETKRLLEFLEMPYSTECNKAFEKKWVANDSQTEQTKTKEERIEEIKLLLSDEFKEASNILYEKYELTTPF